MNKEQALMQQIWLKALRQGKVELKFKNPRDAQKTRFSLYNAVKAVREGKVQNTELLEAVQECTVRFLPPDKVVVEQRMETQQIKDILKGMAIDPADLVVERDLTPEELSQARLMEMLHADGVDPFAVPEAKPKNPYY